MKLVRSVLILLASCQQICMTHTIAVCTEKKTPDDEQRNCPKHVEFYSKNKFVKLVHLVGFIISVHHDAKSPESQINSVIWSAFFFLGPNLFSPKCQSTCPQNFIVQHPRRLFENIYCVYCTLKGQFY